MTNTALYIEDRTAFPQTAITPSITDPRSAYSRVARKSRHACPCCPGRISM